MNDLYRLIEQAKNGDEEAMSKLVLQFDKLLKKLSRNRGIIDEDCYQCLSERFIQAVRKFDINRF
ncbi:helix-turn-helix domain-containing protein [Carnobacterium gallinarum]|uniref:helix-turn-helix domain-containing protein n=1 Tax=Carnobacterium gallinarum TaxID=2749 RepID=UPI00054D1F45|nr:helix-turn-helix domain-containing protein [Carnobacterium gallinarum]